MTVETIFVLCDDQKTFEDFQARVKNKGPRFNRLIRPQQLTGLKSPIVFLHGAYWRGLDTRGKWYDMKIAFAAAEAVLCELKSFDNIP